MSKRRLSGVQKAVWWFMNAPLDEARLALDVAKLVVDGRSGSSDVVARVKARVAKAKKTDGADAGVELH